MNIKLFYKLTTNKPNMMRYYIRSGGTLNELCMRYLVLFPRSNMALLFELVELYAKEKWKDNYDAITRSMRSPLGYFWKDPSLCFFLKNPLLNSLVYGIVRMWLAYEERSN